MKPTKKWMLISLLIFLFAVQSLAGDYPSILPLRERAEIINQWLMIRLEKVLPEVMRREKFDMWIVVCREYNEDPVFLTLVPATSLAARRLTILVFYDRGKEGIERIAVSRYGIGNYYKGVWNPDEMDQWACLAKVVAERNPKRIGINESDTFAFGDGITASLKKKLIESIGSKYASRIKPAERLAVGWLEKRTPEELEVYHHIVSIAHHIIEEAFSNKVITPGITTRQDVVWWIRQKINSLGLKTWFQSSVSIQRPKSDEGEGDRNVIRRGDLLHCDIGITYLRLNTDTQEHAYVLKQGETYAPEGLKKALRLGNRLQDILTGEYREGRTGNEILLASLSKMKTEGINGSIYTHPLGFHGHAAGPTIGLWDQQRAIPGKGDYPLFSNTCYAIELNVRMNIPEWNGQEVRIGLEQDGVYTKRGVYYLDGRQTTFHLVE